MKPYLDKKTMTIHVDPKVRAAIAKRIFSDPDVRRRLRVD